MKHTAAVLFAVLLGTGSLSAQHDHAASTQAPMPHSGAAHDRMFADAMTMHHEDGIRMAQMAVDKASSAEIRTMAAKMIDDQRRQIGRMQALRGDGPKAAMHEMHSMPGMMPEAEMQRDMTRLESLQGHDFQVAFTEIMAKHHQGAITMSKHELQKGSSAGMKEIAREIADMQAKERQQLLALHRELTGAEAMTSSSGAHQRMRKD